MSDYVSEKKAPIDLFSRTFLIFVNKFKIYANTGFLNRIILFPEKIELLLGSDRKSLSNTKLVIL
jgi:hypothetical protein